MIDHIGLLEYLHRSDQKLCRKDTVVLTPAVANTLMELAGMMLAHCRLDDVRREHYAEAEKAITEAKRTPDKNDAKVSGKEGKV